MSDPPPTATPPKPPTDWERIEAEYRAGQLSVSEIARQHHISHTAINKRAKRFDWPRDLSARVRQEVSARLVSDGVSSETARDTIAQAAARDVNVILGHRRGLLKLQERRDHLMERYEALTSAEQLANLDALADAASILETISKIDARVIQLQRQAFNLDDRSGDGPEDRLDSLDD